MSFKLFCICRALWFGNIQDLPTFLCLIYTVPLLTGHDFFMLIFLQLRNVHNHTQCPPAACIAWYYFSYKQQQTAQVGEAEKGFLTRLVENCRERAAFGHPAILKLGRLELFFLSYSS